MLEMETEFARELFQDLREARKLAQWNIKKANHYKKQMNILSLNHIVLIAAKNYNSL